LKKKKQDHGEMLHERERQREGVDVENDSGNGLQHGSREGDQQSDGRFAVWDHPCAPRVDSLELIKAQGLVLSLTISRKLILEEDASFKTFVTMCKGHDWRQEFPLDIHGSNLDALASRCVVTEHMGVFSKFQVMLAELFFFLRISR